MPDLRGDEREERDAVADGQGALPAHYRDDGEVGVPVSDLWLPARPGWALCRLRRRRCRSD